jgi:hypothetical protein
VFVFLDESVVDSSGKVSTWTDVNTFLSVLDLATASIFLSTGLSTGSVLTLSDFAKSIAGFGTDFR